MTRFTYTGEDEYLPIKENTGDVRDKYLKGEEVVELLNTLHQENEQLKADHKRQENEIKLLRQQYNKR